MFQDHEEKIIARIMATETMHDPENYTGDLRIQCTRIEAIRRMRIRTRGGEYREPVGAVKANATLPVTPRQELSPERRAAMAQALAASRTVSATL